MPPTSVMGAENAMPSMARHTSKVSMFWATAQGMTKIHASNRVDPLGKAEVSNAVEVNMEDEGLVHTR